MLVGSIATPWSPMVCACDSSLDGYSVQSSVWAVSDVLVGENGELEPNAQGRCTKIDRDPLEQMRSERLGARENLQRNICRLFGFFSLETC